MAADARIDHAPAKVSPGRSADSLTRYDVAAMSLRYWWVVVALWLAYSVWMFQSVANGHRLP